MNTLNPPITKDDVRLALEQLKQAGQSVTMKKIRATIGSGSLTTIVKYHKQIQNDLTEEARQNDPTEPPSEVKGVGDELSNRMIRHAFEAGLKRGQEQHQTLLENIVTVEQERDELLVDIELKEELLRANETETTQIKTELQVSINVERQRVDVLRAEIDALRIESAANEKSSAALISKLREELHAAHQAISEKRIMLAKTKTQLLLAKEKTALTATRSEAS